MVAATYIALVELARPPDATVWPMLRGRAGATRVPPRSTCDLVATAVGAHYGGDTSAAPNGGSLTLRILFAICLVASGCSAQATPTSRASTPGGSAAAPSASSEPSIDESVVVVRGIFNIFGAGHERAPDPGGGGGGREPDPWPLPSGASRVVTFPSITGEVTPRLDVAPYNGPGGDMTCDTDVQSFDGISGMIDHGNGMFLVGVFLTDAEPADPAPERLDFTDNEDFESLEPQIAQTFFIGDGVGHRYVAPPDATRLFLGFVNAFTYGADCQGQPGYYDNNAGELEVTIDVAIE
jgi:hypothetical protein